MGKSQGRSASRGGVVLIVEDEARVATAIARRAGTRETCVVRSCAEAIEAIETIPRLSGLIADIKLPDGSGLDVVRAARAKDAFLRVLIFTGLLSAELVNQVDLLDAQLLCKPAGFSELGAFFESLDSPTTQVDGGRLALDGLGLTQREIDIVMHTSRGIPRNRLAASLGITENTLKKYVRSVLTKTRQGSLSEALWHLSRRQNSERSANQEEADNEEPAEKERGDD